jgi:hypothetical protein
MAKQTYCLYCWNFIPCVVFLPAQQELLPRSGCFPAGTEGVAGLRRSRTTGVTCLDSAMTGKKKCVLASELVAGVMEAAFKISGDHIQNLDLAESDF